MGNIHRFAPISRGIKRRPLLEVRITCIFQQPSPDRKYRVCLTAIAGKLEVTLVVSFDRGVAKQIRYIFRLKNWYRIC